ncbi:MAG TPA: hypothetical protein VJU16_00640 [Planctomycetota bacterium]|nr:hypothetical protein [Planctomycetota bacterium]
MVERVVVALVLPAAAALLALIAPYRGYLLVIAALVTLWFGYLTYEGFSSHLRSGHYLHSIRVYPLDTSALGTCTVRVATPANCEGVQVWLLTSDGRYQPYESLESPGWKFRDASGLLVRGENSMQRLFSLDEGIGTGDRQWLEISYDVTAENREALSQRRLKVMPSRYDWEWADMTRAISTWVLWGGAAGTLGALAAFIAQVRRRRHPPVVASETG